MSEAERREREARGPHKTSVDIYGRTAAGAQQAFLVSPDGKVLGRTEPLIQSEYDSVITRDANGYITQIVITDGVMTKTIDVTRDANDRITALDETVV